TPQVCRGRRRSLALRLAGFLGASPASSAHGSMTRKHDRRCRVLVRPCPIETLPGRRALASLIPSTAEGWNRSVDVIMRCNYGQLGCDGVTYPKNTLYCNF